MAHWYLQVPGVIQLQARTDQACYLHILRLRLLTVSESEACFCEPHVQHAMELGRAAC